MKGDDKLKTRILQSGAIVIQAGQTFNGNTAELIHRVNRYTLYKIPCMVVKCRAENKYRIDCVCSYDSALAEAIGAFSLQNLYDKIVQHDLMGEYNG